MALALTAIVGGIALSFTAARLRESPGGMEPLGARDVVLSLGILTVLAGSLLLAVFVLFHPNMPEIFRS